MALEYQCKIRIVFNSGGGKGIICPQRDQSLDIFQLLSYVVGTLMFIIKNTHLKMEKQEWAKD